MSYPTRKPCSELTRLAIGDIVKRMAEETGFSEPDLYRILGSVTPDHLLYARDLHRGLCKLKPDAAREYRELLDADADLMSASRPHAAPQTDSYAISHLCQKFLDTVIREGKGDADADVLSDARRLHATLGAFIKAEESKDDVRPRMREVS